MRRECSDRPMGDGQPCLLSTKGLLSDVNEARCCRQQWLKGSWVFVHDLTVCHAQNHDSDTPLC